MIKKHDQRGHIDILQVFRTLSHVDCQRVFWKDTFYRKVWQSFSKSAISEIHLVWPSSFLWKCVEFDVDSRNGTNNSEKVFGFSDDCICIGNCKFCQSSTGYLASAVNVLRDTPKISRNSGWDIFQINLSQNDENTWRKWSHGDLESFCDTFTCWLPKRVPKRRFLQKGLMKFFTVYNFGNTLAMTIIFYFKMFNIWCRFLKWNKKFRKSFSFFR